MGSGSQEGIIKALKYKERKVTNLKEELEIAIVDADAQRKKIEDLGDGPYNTYVHWSNLCNYSIISLLF